MIFNHEGKAVWDFHYTDIVDSRCPICDAPLVGKRYQKKVVWHWAHKPKLRIDCPHVESQWHMLLKIAQSRLPNWIIEHPLDLCEKRYRVDAFNTRHETVREFIHTATPYYRQKHIDLKQACRGRITWIFDGDQFVSNRARANHKDDGHRDFLKERPFQLHEKIGGYVHWDDVLWKHWKNNVWYPFKHPAADRFLDEVRRTEDELNGLGMEHMIQVERAARQPKRDGYSVNTAPSISQSTNR